MTKHTLYTQTPDDQAAVQALAEAMMRETYSHQADCNIWADNAIQAIRANPGILRSMGFGRLPTESDVLHVLKMFGLNLAEYREATARRFVHEGYALPDPAPEAPELPSVMSLISDVHTWDDFYESDPAKATDAWMRFESGLTKLHAAAEAGRTK